MKPYYEHGGITIYHGDCRDVLPLSCDLILADPPYGVPSLLRGGSGKSSYLMPNAARATTGYRLKVQGEMMGNDGPFDPSHLLFGPKAILWGGNHYADKLPVSAAWMTWDKREGQASDHGADCEMAWTNLKGPARLYSQLWRGMCRRGEENGKARVHPTQKPVALMRWCIDRAKLESNSLVVDPYAGSGTALVAAYRLGHSAIGIEIEERYCEIAAKRLAQEVLPLEAVS